MQKTQKDLYSIKIKLGKQILSWGVSKQTTRQTYSEFILRESSLYNN